MSKRRGLPDTSRMRHDSHFVEQLVRADELPIGRKIGVHLIDANPNQPRSVLGDLSDLKQSIAEKGVLEPILVRPREDERFTIISGERRFRAAVEAGLAEVPCIEMQATDAEVLEIALIENLQRKDLNPFEEADGYLALQEKHSYTHEAIAKAVGKSRVTITETVSLAKLPESVKDECRRADIESKSFLLELGRLPTEEAMLHALRAFLSGESITRDLLREEKRATAADRPPLRKAFTLDFAPEDRSYKVSLVFHASNASREHILGAIREVARRIGSGDLDLESSGRFLRQKAAPESSSVQDPAPIPDDAPPQEE